jgi:hypothetical protein
LESPPLPQLGGHSPFSGGYKWIGESRPTISSFTAETWLSRLSFLLPLLLLLLPPLPPPLPPPLSKKKRKRGPFHLSVHRLPFPNQATSLLPSASQMLLPQPEENRSSWRNERLRPSKRCHGNLNRGRDIFFLYFFFYLVFFSGTLSIFRLLIFQTKISWQI